LHRINTKSQFDLGMNVGSNLKIIGVLLANLNCNGCLVDGGLEDIGLLGSKLSNNFRSIPKSRMGNKARNVVEAIDECLSFFFMLAN